MSANFFKNFIRTFLCFFALSFAWLPNTANAAQTNSKKNSAQKTPPQTTTKTDSIESKIEKTKKKLSTPNEQLNKLKSPAVFEFLAEQVKYEKNKVIGNGGVSVISGEYLLSADFAEYEPKSGEIALSGNVSAYKGSILQIKAQNIKVQLDKDSMQISRLFLQDATSGVWVEALNADTNGNLFSLDNAKVSACSVRNPIWHLEANRVEFDNENEWLSLYAPKVCIMNVPILVLPYLSFSAGYKRKTGLLYPSVGYSKDDGLLFYQPLFIAPKKSWDATITPIVRSRRGFGGNLEFRIADEINQVFWLNLGYFKNNKSYLERQNLQREHHSGGSMRYERKDMLSKTFDIIEEDGIFLEANEVSDIDFYRIQFDNSIRNHADLQGSLLTSRSNYFMRSDNNYFGLYGRYYNDLSLSSNSQTFQNIPQLHFHRHDTQLFFDNLYFSADYQLKNYTRARGYTALQNELIVPLLYSKSLFGDFLNISIKPQLYATSVEYHRTQNQPPRDASYMNTSYTFTADSNLVRDFTSFQHLMHLQAQYLLPQTKSQNGDFTELFSLPGDRRELKLRFFQQFNSYTAPLSISHKVEHYRYPQQERSIGETQNEIIFDYGNLEFISDIWYSHDKAKISESSHSLNLKYEKISFGAGHYYRRDFAHEDFAGAQLGEADYISASAKISIGDFDLYGNLGYNRDLKKFRTWEVGLDTYVRCFSLGLKYVSEIYPTLTKNGLEARDDKYVMLTLRFIPLSGHNVKIMQ